MEVSRSMRDVLIEHLDGKMVHINAVVGYDAGRRKLVIGAALSRGWIKTCGSEVRPTHTQITDAGRTALAKILGEYADVLYRAGFESLPPQSSMPTVIGAIVSRRRRDTMPPAE
jgi:hypothetical protein